MMDLSESLRKPNVNVFNETPGLDLESRIGYGISKADICQWQVDLAGVGDGHDI